MAKPVTIADLLKSRAKKKAKEKAAKAVGRKARGAAYHKNHPKPVSSNKPKKPKKPKRVIQLKKFNYV